MKSFIALVVLVSLSSVQAVTIKPSVPVNNSKDHVAKEKDKSKEPNSLDKKAEDCDDKAKKPVEITPESISLSGTTGCSLDEAHP